MRSFAAMVANVAIEGGSRTHQGFPDLIDGGAPGDKLFLRTNPHSGSEPFVLRVESGSDFGVLFLQSLPLGAEHLKKVGFG